jgi:hypothetical protein
MEGMTMKAIPRPIINSLLYDSAMAMSLSAVTQSDSGGDTRGFDGCRYMQRWEAEIDGVVRLEIV